MLYIFEKARIHVNYVNFSQNEYMVDCCEYYVDIFDVAYLYDDIWMDVLM